MNGILWSAFLVIGSAFAAQDEELTTHAKARELFKEAQHEDWTGFLGPRRDGKSGETHLLDNWESAGPTLLWERACGSGFASPVTAGERLVITHRVGDLERIECLEASSGKRLWRAEFACDFKGEFISDHGPRSTPVIDGERVYVHGVAGVMRCLSLDSGELQWEADWATEFSLPEAWFGVVSSPLVHGDLLIQNLGEPAAGSVAAFNKMDGKLVWETAPGGQDQKTWGASCASPVIAHVAGQDRLFVLTGGKSKPPRGGLMVLDPANGELQLTHAFRSREYYSVNGTSPLVVGDQVLLSSSYGVGSVCLNLVASEQGGGLKPATSAWKDRRLGLQFGNPINLGQRLFVANGAPGGVGSLQLLSMSDGKQQSELFLEHLSHVGEGDQEQEMETSSGEASLLWADDKLYCLGDDGSLFLLDVSGSKPVLLASAALFHARWAWTPPVISRGLLYIRQTTVDEYSGRSPRLLCYDLRAAR